MATSHVKKRRKSATGKKSAPFVSADRKREVLGLIMMALGVLMALAVLTFNPADAELLRESTLRQTLDPAGPRTGNLLGVVGARIAEWLVPQFLGYTVIVFPALLIAWGFVVLRNRGAGNLPLATVLSIVSGLVAATVFGWFGHMADSIAMLTWGGRFGMATAATMMILLGSVGSMIVLVLMVAVLTLLFFDLDVQRSIDRVEDVISRSATVIRGWWDESLERRHEKRLAREDSAEQRREARERQNKSRPAPSDSTEGASASPRPGPSRPTPSKPAPSNPASSNPAIPNPATPRTLPAATGSGPTINDLYSRSGAQPEPEAAPPSPPRPEQRPAAPPPRPAAPPPANPIHVDASSADGPSLTVRERVSEERADKIERSAEVPDDRITQSYKFPTVDLLDDAEDTDPKIDYSEIEENKQILVEKLGTYNVEIAEINVIVGPTVTMYELTPAPGVKISRITALEDDLAMALAARGIRIIAPIPGKSAVGVEIPNRHRELVRLRDVIGTARFRDTKMELPIPFGKSIEGEVFLQDLTKLPHLLIAGATGSGKSVGLNTIITGLLYACHPANLKFVMIDPKKIELQQYASILDHFVAMPEGSQEPIITDFNMALGVLKSCEKEMERRYDLLAAAGVRGIKDYNRKLQEGALVGEEHEHLPYIVVIVDELADLMMTAGKDIESPIARLAQMARAVGIHLILATQRPSVDVITGLIKANFPARIAYQVASKIDSRTILDQNGAEGLVGNGDMLFMLGSRMLRLQGPYVSDDELERITTWIGGQRGPGSFTLPAVALDGEDEVEELLGVEDADDLFEEAARIIVRSQQGSVSLLQRRLSVGYTRAARIVDQLEEAGIVGPFVGSKAREVLVQDEIHLDQLLSESREE